MDKGTIIRVNTKENNGYIRVYLYNTEDIVNSGDPYMKRLYNLLPSFRKEKVDKIKNETTKVQSIAAFGLLGYAIRQLSNNKNCKLLDEEFGPGIEADWEKLGYAVDTHGKPFFDKIRNIYFSLSHTNGMVMCVVADRPIGCDVEIINRYKVDYDAHTYAEERKRLAQRFYTTAECKYIDESKNDAEVPKRFTRVWTKKESYIKFLGLGLSKPLNEFNTFACDPMPIVVFEDDKFIASICADLK